MNCFRLTQISVLLNTHPMNAESGSIESRLLKVILARASIGPAELNRQQNTAFSWRCCFYCSWREEKWISSRYFFSIDSIVHTRLMESEKRWDFLFGNISFSLSLSLRVNPEKPMATCWWGEMISTLSPKRSRQCCWSEETSHHREREQRN